MKSVHTVLAVGLLASLLMAGSASAEGPWAPCVGTGVLNTPPLT